MAGCRAGQHSLDWPDQQGLFAWCLAGGYAGRADPNHDGRVEPTELMGFLQKAMAQAGDELKVVQTPELFLPDDRRPRLSPEAKKAIRRLAAFVSQSKIDADEASREYKVAAGRAGKELEPRLLYGLVLIKLKDRDTAIQHFEELKNDQPELLVALEALTWLRFDKRSYTAAVNELAGLVGKVPKPKKPGEPYSPQGKHIFYWAGQLRQFVELVLPDAARPLVEAQASLDAAIAAHGSEALELYQ
ncbi:MAG: hypothetical protein ABSF26_31235 [Thermoguttaceae bacterium]